MKNSDCATVLFDTDPKAEGYLKDLQALQIEPAEEGEDGFARSRNTL